MLRCFGLVQQAKLAQHGPQTGSRLEDVRILKVELEVLEVVGRLYSL
jgi:hypothetical protein